MEDLIRTAARADIKNLFKAALEQKKETGIASDRANPIPSLYGRAGQYRPVDEILREETVTLRSR